MTSITSSGPARVVDQGMVTTFLGCPLRLEVDVGPGAPLGIELRFVTDPAVEGVAASTEPTPTGLAVDVINFHGSEGRGSGEPLILRQIGAIVYLLHFRVWWIGKTRDPSVQYVVFAAERDALAELVRSKQPAASVDPG